MEKYYTRACNFYYGNYSQRLINKKKTLPLSGNSKISFDHPVRCVWYQPKVNHRQEDEDPVIIANWLKEMKKEFQLINTEVHYMHVKETRNQENFAAVHVLEFIPKTNVIKAFHTNAPARY